MLFNTIILKFEATLGEFKMILIVIVVVVVAEVPLENIQLNNINTNLINILQNVLDKIVVSFENNDISTEHQIMLQKMFQCLEILYNNIALSQEQAILVHTWLRNYCKFHDIEGSEHVIVHKLLFAQFVRTQKGPFLEGIAKQIETVLGQIHEVRNNVSHYTYNCHI